MRASDYFEPEKLMANVAIRHDGCWLWNGYINKDGYAQTRIAGQSWKLHRLFFQVFKGPLVSGLQIDHICRVRSCVNPTHLRQVTPRENTLCGVSPSAQHAKKLVCHKGHQYDYRSDKGIRICRKCKNENSRKTYHERRKRLLQTEEIERVKKNEKT